MALLLRRAGNIPERFVSFEAYSKDFAGRHTVQGKTSAHKRHRAEVVCYIYFSHHTLHACHDSHLLLPCTRRCSPRTSLFQLSPVSSKGFTMAEKPADPRLLGLTAQIIAAHAANTSMETATLPTAIREVY